MIKLARLLPLVTVVVWAITLIVPVLDSKNTYGPRIVVTSLGGAPFDLTEVEPTFVFGWIIILLCAFTGLVLRPRTAWSVIVMLVSALVTALLIQMVVDPPMLMWDGQDDQGRPTGGMEVAEPVAGAALWLVGLAALFAAGILGLFGAERSARKAPPSTDRTPS